jgi:hypothetical protein
MVKVKVKSRGKGKFTLELAMKAQRGEEVQLYSTLDAGLLARSQYPEGPATGHLDTGLSWFPSVYKRMLRWFPSFQVATTCLSCSPSDLNSLVTFFSHICVHVK